MLETRAINVFPPLHIKQMLSFDFITAVHVQEAKWDTCSFFIFSPFVALLFSAGLLLGSYILNSS